MHLAISSTDFEVPLHNIVHSSHSDSEETKHIGFRLHAQCITVFNAYNKQNAVFKHMSVSVSSVIFSLLSSNIPLHG